MNKFSEEEQSSTTKFYTDYIIIATKVTNIQQGLTKIISLFGEQRYYFQLKFKTVKKKNIFYKVN
jgi:hypothetical protein